jgi:aspartate 1-decarboxylase
MYTTMLKAKLHRVTVTHSELEYEGSCAIDGSLLDEAGVLEYEQIHIYNVNNGLRFTTYAIRANPSSGIISVNGAAARLAAPKDILIICAYASYSVREISNYKPRLLYVNENNQVLRTSDHISG